MYNDFNFNGSNNKEQNTKVTIQNNVVCIDSNAAVTCSATVDLISGRLIGH